MQIFNLIGAGSGQALSAIINPGDDESRLDITGAPMGAPIMVALSEEECAIMIHNPSSADAETYSFDMQFKDDSNQFAAMTLQQGTTGNTSFSKQTIVGP